MLCKYIISFGINNVEGLIASTFFISNRDTFYFLIDIIEI